MKQMSQKNRKNPILIGRDRLKHSVPFTAWLIGLFFAGSAFAQIPVINSVSPLVAKVGDTITISGSNFNSTPAYNIVMLGATRARVVSGSSVLLKAIVDTGATYAPVFLEDSVTHRSCYQKGFFSPDFIDSFFIPGDINFISTPTVYSTRSGASPYNSPYTVVIGDFDSDGKPDLAVNGRGTSSDTGAILIYKNVSRPGVINGSSFSLVATLQTGRGQLPTNLKIADIDGDGRMDVVFSLLAGSRIGVNRNTSSGGSISFENVVYYAENPHGVRYGNAPNVVSVADFDGDGRPDVAVSQRDTNTFVVFRNRSTPGTIDSASFAVPVAFQGFYLNYGICTADFNGDGLVDVAMADDSEDKASIFINTSTGPGVISFAAPDTFGVGAVPSDMQVGDIDGDSKPDLIVANTNAGTMSILRNTSSGTTVSFARKVDFATNAAFVAAYSISPYPVGIAVGDVNGDGKADIVVTNANPVGSVSIFRNTASTGPFSASTLATPEIYDMGGSPIGVNIGDLDGDGYPDLAIGQYYYNYFSILRNYPLPYVARIMGADSTCVTGGTISYTDSTVGGAWSVSNTSLATISTAGVLRTIAPGRDTIYYTVFAGGDSNRVMKVLRIDSSSTVAPIRGAASICVAGTATYSDSTAFGIWTSSDTSILRIAATGVARGVALGAAIISYSVTNSCGTSFDTAIVRVVTSPVAGTISGRSSVCPGDSVTLTSSASGGTWSSDSVTRATVNATSGVVTGVSLGRATIIYTVVNACGSANASRAVSITSSISAGTISGRSSVCEGDTTTLTDTVSGGRWATDLPGIATVDTLTGLVTGVSDGNANITYTVTNSCGTARATRVVTVNPAPYAAPITGVSAICLATTTTSALSDTSSGGTWSSTNTTVATVSGTGVVHGRAAGNTLIVYTVSNACGTDTASVNFHIDASAFAGTITGSSTVCLGTPISMSDTIVGGTWSSSNTSVATVSGTGSVNGVTTGTATISYTISNTCGTSSATNSVTVSNMPFAGSISGATSFCEGSPSTLSASGSGGTWSSTNVAIATIGSVSGIAQGITSGVDTILYIVANGCGADTARASITINPLPSAGTISGGGPLCAGNTTTLGITPVSASGNWSSGNNAIATVSASGTVRGVSSGSAAISYTVVNGCGSASTSLVINVITAPTAATITGPATVCMGASVTQTNATAGGTWLLTNTNASLPSAGRVTGITAGFDTLLYIVSNTCGRDTAHKSIQILALPDTGVIVGPTSLCVGDTITLTDTAAGVWGIRTGASSVSVSPSGVVTGYSGGVAIITYTATNANCGSLSASHVLFVNLPADAGTLSGRDTICPGIVDSLAGGYGIKWVSTDTLLATVTADGVVRSIGAGDVTIYNIDSNVCSIDTARFAIHINPGVPSAGIISGPDSACVGTTVALSETSAGGLWTTGNTTVASVSGTGLVRAIAAGNVNISYTVGNSCGSAFVFRNFRVSATPLFTSPISASVCDNRPFTYVPSCDTIGATFAWSRSIVPFVSNAAAAGTGTISETLNSTADTAVHTSYTFIYSAHGCADSARVSVAINPLPRLTSRLTDTVCSGSPFVYIDSESTGAATSALWSRGIVTSITPATGSGVHTIRETLTSNVLTPKTVIYQYLLSSNGCTDSQQVSVTVLPAPPGPEITTHSPASVCSESEYQNFGTAAPPSAGIDYTWLANGAQIWATGTTRQYCLVNFNTPGNAVITLRASVGGGNCPSETSYSVLVNANVAEKPSVIYFNGDFVCLANNMDSYQWGVDDVATLDSTIVTGATNQNYSNSNPDFTHNYYWVITQHNGCMQKTYYNTPLLVGSTVKHDNGVVTIIPNPNNGSFTFRLSSARTEEVNVLFTDLVGKVISSQKVATNHDQSLVLDVPAGVYFLSGTTATDQFTAKIVITQ